MHWTIRWSGFETKLITHLHLMPGSKDLRSHTSTPQYVFMAWCSVEVQGKLYLFNMHTCLRHKCLHFVIENKTWKSHIQEIVDT
jgi:hypothetical protein